MPLMRLLHHGVMLLQYFGAICSMVFELLVMVLEPSCDKCFWRTDITVQRPKSLSSDKAFLTQPYLLSSHTMCFGVAWQFIQHCGWLLIRVISVKSFKQFSDLQIHHSLPRIISHARIRASHTHRQMHTDG